MKILFLCRLDMTNGAYLIYLLTYGYAYRGWLQYQINLNHLFFIRMIVGVLKHIRGVLSHAKLTNKR